MTKDVLISISGLQFEGPAEPHHDKVELMVGGRYHMEDGCHVIEYEEEMDGMPGRILSRIVASPDRMEMTKSGAMAVSMIFEKGQKNLSRYGTPFGSLMVGIDTTSIKLKEQEDRLDIEVLYHLELNYEYFADARVIIGVQSKQL